MAVSDYVGARVLNGTLHLIPYTVIDKPIDSIFFSGTVYVKNGAVKKFSVPAGSGVRIVAKKTSQNDSFLNSIEVNCSDDEFPNIVSENFEGTYEYFNDTAHFRELTFRCVPISSHENSQFDVVISAMFSRVGHMLENFTDGSPYPDYVSGPQLVMSWDMFRHPTVVLDYKITSEGEVPVSYKRVVDSWQGETFIFEKRFLSGISKVQVSVDIKLHSDDGQFSVYPNKSKIPADLSQLYQNYENNISETSTSGVAATTSTSTSTSTTSNNTTSTGTSGGY